MRMRFRVFIQFLGSQLREMFGAIPTFLLNHNAFSLTSGEHFLVPLLRAAELSLLLCLAVQVVLAVAEVAVAVLHK